MTPDVSVIIAAYNVAPYIRRAIQSALSQEGVSLEVVIVDDASTDDTWDIVSAIDDPRLKKLKNTENKGPSVSRNAAFAMASGEWLAVLDGDDAFLPNRLEGCIRRARATQADIVVDNLTVYREADGATYSMFDPSRFTAMGRLSLASFIAGNQDFLSGNEVLGYLKPLFSAAFLRAHHLSYDPDIRIGEDYMLMAECLACGAVCAVEPQAGYRYTVRRGSISYRLTCDDVARMQSGDRKFLSKYKLAPADLKAQKKRAFNLRETYSFIQLVDAIKAKKILAALGIAMRRPTSMLYLWHPIWVRLRRIGSKKQK